MSAWWDDDAQKYRTTLVYKIFYIWCWPATRWIMFNCMSSERAHWVAIHIGIPLVSWLDRIWTWGFVVPSVVLIVIALRLLALLPGFRWDAPPSGGKRHV